MHKKYAPYIFGGLLIILIAIAGYTLTASRGSQGWNFMPPKSGAPSTGVQKVYVTGQLTCLPHLNAEGPQTMECAIGIKSEDGTYYALLDGSADVMNTPMNEPVRVSGMLTHPPQGNYNTAGTIAVQSFVKL